jgi:crotonobetainyl-CoA:carnitine CoA-transferase CaiB-like acyl-CoA transferase
MLFKRKNPSAQLRARAHNEFSRRHQPTRYRDARKREHWSATYPYGVWTCSDGREVLFNRRYAPIWQRYPNEWARPAEATEWVSWVRQRWFYNDGTPPNEAEANIAVALREWGLR